MSDIRVCICSYNFIQFNLRRMCEVVCVCLCSFKGYACNFFLGYTTWHKHLLIPLLTRTHSSVFLFLLLADTTRISRGAAWRCLHAPTSWDITTADIRGCLPGAYVHIVERELSVCECVLFVALKAQTNGLKMLTWPRRTGKSQVSPLRTVSQLHMVTGENFQFYVAWFPRVYVCVCVCLLAKTLTHCQQLKHEKGFRQNFYSQQGELEGQQEWK